MPRSRRPACTAMERRDGERHHLNAEAYTALHLVDQNLKNGNNKQSGFHLMPLRFGTPRHQAVDQFDFWVTAYRWGETLADELVKSYVNGENTLNTDVVVWYTGALHHAYRNEDGFSKDGKWQGSALLMSTEFQLKPMNLFSKTPLYP